MPASFSPRPDGDQNSSNHRSPARARTSCPLIPVSRRFFWTGNANAKSRRGEPWPTKKPRMGLDLVFASPVTGRHYRTTPIQQDYIRPAGWCLVECPRCGAGFGVWCQEDGTTPNGKRLPIHEERQETAGKYDGVGWHTFRHTYRSWLDDSGAPIGVNRSSCGTLR